MEDENMSEDIENYFENISEEVKTAYTLAKKARKKGYDPEDDVNLPLAKNMAERVEGLIGVMIPQIINSGLSKRILELEKKYKKLNWRVALTIALEVAEEKFCKLDNQLKAIETGIRVGLAYLTLGIVASPLEGFIKLDLKKRKDGKDYFCMMFSGPIRSAGGTAGAVSVIIADYLRKKMGYDVYDPTEKEIRRTVTELYDYHERVTNLQYLPSEKEIRFLIEHLPVQIDGDPSEKIEVSNYKDVPRIETNQIRSGVCLVVGECLAQKASKLWANVSKWMDDFELEQWLFLNEFIDLQKKVKSKTNVEFKEKIAPVFTYIEDLVAGRPVLTHPLGIGGFRLRYGRSRASGYSSAAIHPATMHILNRYLAIGTQLKVERPGKATAITACDSIEGPIVKLKNGNLVKINTIKDIKSLTDEIKEILFLGDIMFSYGDFYNRAHQLVPAGYCEEWWALELEHATVDLFGTLDTEKLSELLEIPSEELTKLLKNPLLFKPDAQQAINISQKLKVPLHPSYNYYWKTISPDNLLMLVNWMNDINIVTENNVVNKIILPFDEAPKRVLELLGIEHIVVNNEHVVLEKESAIALAVSLNLKEQNDIKKIKDIITENKEKNTLEIINILSEIQIRDKSGVFIGARMGRPEKAKMRKLKGSPHVLFPVGKEGGRLRSFQSCLEAGNLRADLPIYRCQKCKKDTIFSVCEDCNKKTKKLYNCRICGLLEKDKCPKHEKTESFKTQNFNIKKYLESTLKKLKINSFPDLIKGVRGTSNKDHTPEPLAKGILRAKHDVYVNKDGTTRYDMTQLPITHFKPKEINVPVEKLKELGYSEDIHGKSLENHDQVLELKPQDLILPACDENPEIGADKILFKVGLFIDELLEKFYNVDKFYNFKSETDTIGALVVVLAPHTSAGTIGRVIGFSNTQGFFAHPMFHAATRRDCDGDEASVMLLMDVLLNFSRKFLPGTRGATQDAPLVLTSKIIPSEVDDMVFDMDVSWRYPLEFYEACLNFKQPRDVDIEQFGNNLNTPKQYKGLGYTHFITNLNSGVMCSAYKILPSMEEKLKGQMDLADKIRAVDAPDVARLVIEKHFLRDIKGNLRKFSTQQFRCVNCNEKYRRPPLANQCIKCNGKIIFTLTEGSIVKYLEPAISLADKYNLPSYLKQTLELTKRNVESIFGREKEKQIGLGKWF
jgi:DNA polymerase II large subunit